MNGIPNLKAILDIAKLIGYHVAMADNNPDKEELYKTTARKLEEYMAILIKQFEENI